MCMISTSDQCLVLKSKDPLKPGEENTFRPNTLLVSETANFGNGSAVPGGGGFIGGGPGQQGNRTSCFDGTYLEFRDGENMEPF